MKISSWTQLKNKGFDPQNYGRFLGTDSSYSLEIINVSYRKSKGLGVWVYGISSSGDNTSIFIRNKKIIDFLKGTNKRKITFSIASGGVKDVV